MILSIIVAVAQNGVIGKDNRLIWHLPNDMKFFKEKTTGHCVITGRKNYESIPPKFRPLPNRTNLIITRNKNYQAPGATLCFSLEEAIKKAQDLNETECFIIGGGEIFKNALPLCQRLYLTKVHHAFEGDVYFSELNNTWKLISEQHFLADEKHAYPYSFCIYDL